MQTFTTALRSREKMNVRGNSGGLNCTMRCESREKTRVPAGRVLRGFLSAARGKRRLGWVAERGISRVRDRRRARASSDLVTRPEFLEFPSLGTFRRVGVRARPCTAVEPSFCRRDSCHGPRGFGSRERFTDRAARSSLARAPCTCAPPPSCDNCSTSERSSRRSPCTRSKLALTVFTLTKKKNIYN